MFVRKYRSVQYFNFTSQVPAAPSSTVSPVPLGNQPHQGFKVLLNKPTLLRQKKMSRKPSHFFHFSKFHLYVYCILVLYYLRIYSFLILNQAGLTAWFFLGESRSKSETGTSESPFFGLCKHTPAIPTYLDTAMDHMDQSNSPVVFRTGWAIRGLWIPNSTVQFDDSPDAKVEPTRETMSPWSGEETKSCSVPWMETFIEKNEFLISTRYLVFLGGYRGVFSEHPIFWAFSQIWSLGKLPSPSKKNNNNLFCGQEPKFWVLSCWFGSGPLESASTKSPPGLLKRWCWNFWTHPVVVGHGCRWQGQEDGWRRWKS